MKKVFLILLLFNLTFVFSQSVTGVVIDENNEPLAGATIYFDGSSYGTTTNMEGKFRITIPSKISSPLIISFVGFEKLYLDDLNYDKTYKIVLKESTENLKEIVLTNNLFSRKQMLLIFRNQFLGTTRAGKKCTIENEDEIYFSYDNNKFVLIAYADKPLVINNPDLGYKVYYDLVRFETKFNRLSINSTDVYSSVYGGTSRFEEIDNSNKKIKNREKVFKGSFIQLFRNIANQEWGKDKFLLFKGKFQDNPDSHLLIKDTLGVKQVLITKQEKGINSKGFVAEFNLLYDKKEQSKVVFYTDNFTIDYYGLFTNYDKIYFSGAISEKRVGDLLPFNYGIE